MSTRTDEVFGTDKKVFQEIERQAALAELKLVHSPVRHLGTEQNLEILKRISKKEDYEVYPVVTVKKGNDPELYLEKKGLKNLIPNIVRMPYLKKTTQKIKV